MNELLFFVTTLLPAAKTLIVIGAVFTVLQSAKLSPWLGKYIYGWRSLAINILLTALGLLMTIPAQNLYTLNTLILVITATLGSAGIHGTKQAFTKQISPTTEEKQ